MTTRNSSPNFYPWVLGISASHNGAACLLHGNEIRVAIQEERLTGLKRARIYGGRRSLAVRYCMETAGVDARDLSMVGLSCQRSAAVEENDIWLNPHFSGLPELPRRIMPHHLAHAAGAFAASGFDSAAVLVVDGLGSPIEDLCQDARRVVVDPCEGAAEHLSLFHARRQTLRPLEIHVTRQWLDGSCEGMPRFSSLGGMYSAVARQIFGDPMEAGKVMGLAPYGNPCIPVSEFLEFDGKRICFPNEVQRRFQFQEQWPAHEEAYRDLAASVQNALETILLQLAIRLRRLTGEANLCLAGGVALNSVANQRICEEAGFENVYIIPSAEDSGVAIGAAYLGLWQLGGESPRGQMRTDSLGRTSTEAEIEAAIRSISHVSAEKPADLAGEAAVRLHRGEIGAWFQGGAELGPRALGHRSIICSPCGESAKDILNARVKFRESFRPFAPAVLAEHAGAWFDFGASPADSPFMLRVVPFRPEQRRYVPAVVHCDGTGRLQTVAREDDAAFYGLIERFFQLSGVPMLLNTSMNVQGEPMAETPSDALWCLLGMGIDFCVVHDWLITKNSAFGSVLDFVPAVTAEHYTLRMDVCRRALRKSIDREDAVSLRVRTPWGTTDTVLPLRLLELLSRVDGARGGYALQQSLPGNPSARQVANDLLLLRRMHMIEFLKPYASGN